MTPNTILRAIPTTILCCALNLAAIGAPAKNIIVLYEGDVIQVQPSASSIVSSKDVIVPKNYEAIKLQSGQILVRKQAFILRHPKLHTIGRVIRKKCQTVAPVVQFAGNVAQLITSLKR